MCKSLPCQSLGLSDYAELMSSCRRLSLTCMSYLWQRHQEELLSEMIDAGLEAILIKVAGIGLTVKHLGKTLAQMQRTLKNLVTLISACPILPLIDQRTNSTEAIFVEKVENMKP
jgi:hypothetical protein